MLPFRAKYHNTIIQIIVETKQLYAQQIDNREVKPRLFLDGCDREEKSVEDNLLDEQIKWLGKHDLSWQMEECREKLSLIWALLAAHSYLSDY